MWGWFSACSNAGTHARAYCNVDSLIPNTHARAYGNHYAISHCHNRTHGNCYADTDSYIPMECRYSLLAVNYFPLADILSRYRDLLENDSTQEVRARLLFRLNFVIT